MKPIKLVILAGPLDNQNAGVHRVTYELIKGLYAIADPELQVTLIRGKRDDLFPNFKSTLIPFFKWIPGFQSFRLFVIVPLYCIFTGADIVFEPAHFGPFNLPKRIKRVTFIHDITPVLFPEFHTFNGAFLQKLFLPRILKGTDLIIVNSDNTLKDVEYEYPFTKGKVKRIYLGVSENFVPTQTKTALKKFKISKPFFLAVNTIEPRKNLNVLISAYCIFRDNNPDQHQLILVGGKGWKNEKIFKQIAQHKYSKDIIITGFVSNKKLQELYSHCEAFIFPSIYEGFGLPVMEAAFCGAQVIVANNSSLKEIAPNKNLIFETLDKNSLVEKMELVVKNKVNNDLESLKLKYSWHNFTISFVGALKRLISNSKV